MITSTSVLSETAKNDVRKSTKWKICNRNKSNAHERPQDGALCLVNLVGMTMKTSLPFTYEQSLAYTKRCFLTTQTSTSFTQSQLWLWYSVSGTASQQNNKTSTAKELKWSYTTDWSKVKPEHCTRLTVWNGLASVSRLSALTICWYMCTIFTGQVTGR